MSTQQDEAFSKIFREILEANKGRSGIYAINARAVQDPLGNYVFTWEWFYRPDNVVKESEIRPG